MAILLRQIIVGKWGEPRRSELMYSFQLEREPLTRNAHHNDQVDLTAHEYSIYIYGRQNETTVLMMLGTVIILNL
jgi:hypothetical protein